MGATNFAFIVADGPPRETPGNVNVPSQVLVRTPIGPKLPTYNDAGHPVYKTLFAKLHAGLSEDGCTFIDCSYGKTWMLDLVKLLYSSRSQHRTVQNRRIALLAHYPGQTPTKSALVAIAHRGAMHHLVSRLPLLPHLEIRLPLCL